MSDDDRMSVEAEQEMVWKLTEDRRNVRLALPLLPLAGRKKSLQLFLDFDAESVDAMIDRLMMLRSQMLALARKPGRRY